VDGQWRGQGPAPTHDPPGRRCLTSSGTLEPAEENIDEQPARRHPPAGEALAAAGGQHRERTAPRRELVRTNNKPLGDVAEYVVWLARGGVLERNSTKSHDITTPSGHRIQVKAMENRAAGAGAKFSSFRSAGYHTAVFLVFDAAFEIMEAYEVGADHIEQHVRFVPHVAGRQSSLTQVRTLGTDITAEMQNDT